MLTILIIYVLFGGITDFILRLTGKATKLTRILCGPFAWLVWMVEKGKENGN